MSDSEDVGDSRQFLKDEYSTFIEELQVSTEKLMDEVFNKPYYPSIDSVVTLKKQSNPHHTQSFEQFLHRNSEFLQRKKLWTEREKMKRQRYELNQLRDVPNILRGSKKVETPLYQRCIDLHKSLERKLTAKRIQMKRQLGELTHQHTFHPQVNTGGHRTIEEYLKDKELWQEKKLHVLECKRLAEEAKKYTECTFTPNLISKQINFSGEESVQSRLLRSLQKVQPRKGSKKNIKQKQGKK